MPKINELKKQGKYVYRYSYIGFQGKGASAPQREGGEIDKWDKVFDSKDEYEKWYRELVTGLAELDEVMNYCKYFKRESGNKGYYVRDNKSHEVDGQWDGYHIKGTALFPYKGLDYNLMAPFRTFLKENNWYENWFELMDRYKT